MFRRGVAESIHACPEFTLVGEASNGREALRLVAELTPDVVVSDVDMPDLDGLTLAEQLLAENPQARIVILSMHQQMRFVRKAIEMGVLAYILKDDSIDGVVEGIKAAARGARYVSPSLAANVLDMKASAAAGRKNSGTPALLSLTPAERKVLKHVAQNRMTKEIAHELGISPRTVSTHRNNISTKLGLTDQLPLLNWALLNQEEILDLD